MALTLGLTLALCALAAQATDIVKPEPFPSINALDFGNDAVSRGPSRGHDRSVRMVNGQEATLGQFPHQVALYIDMSAFCGGSLIAPKWILTAATCTSSKYRARYTAFLGALNINMPSEKGRVAVTTITSYKPDNFDEATKTSDIALIQLPRNINPTAAIKPITLAARSSETYVGTSFLASGWGYTSDSSVAISSVLKYVTLKGISNVECAQTYGYEVINDGVLCALGDSKQSPCQGDTGGALVLSSDRIPTQTLVAVASFTPGKGCTNGKPAGFTRVSPHLAWIAALTGLNV